VLDNIRNTLEVFTDEGRYLETIDLTACWGKEPNYPSSIVADSEGGVLVHDSGGRPPLVRMTLDGQVRARLDPRKANGQAREEYRRAVRFAPDGRMWTTDGHEFVRLDEQGIVDLQLGQPARIESIESPGHAVIDSTFGRLLILDDRTRALHVFDAEGRRVALCRPRPEELDALRLPLRTMCDSSGGALAADSRHSRKHVRFTADGASRGSEKLEGVNVAFVPGRDAYWSVVKSAPALIGASGEQERAIPRLADGSWWRSIEDLSVAIDGTLVVLDLPGTSDGITRRPGAGLVARFDAEGRPLGQHALPNGVAPAQVSHAGPWVLLSYYSEQAFLIDTRDGNLRALELPAEMGSEAERAWGLAPSGDELWVLEAKARRLLRFALPD
jgi:sugar lactone lactonase YvrE